MNVRPSSGTLYPFLGLCLFGLLDLHAESSLGISPHKPAAGVPVVEIAGNFLVPYQEKIPGTDIQFEMIPIPGGVVLMGSAETEANHQPDEGPQVEVTVPPMWVAKCEVTWAEYKEYMALYRHFKRFQAEKQRKVTDANRIDAVTAPTPLFDPSHTFEYGEDPRQPAITATQYAAKQYSKWLSRITGRQYRLPTEAEWEYACRGGTTTPWSWGESDAEIEQYAWFQTNATAGPQIVGKKKANPFGLHDMHGNVAEWCVDHYTESGYSDMAGKKLTAFEAAKFGGPAYPRVVRGGSWEMPPENLRSAARLGSHDVDWKGEDPNIPLSPWWFSNDPARGVGFRLFRSYEPLNAEGIAKFWEIDNDDIRADVESRIQEGRGVLGLVDPELPKAIQALK
jgi:formylglycine-generating enzyme required for sulfatase activity